MAQKQIVEYTLRLKDEMSKRAGMARKSVNLLKGALISLGGALAIRQVVRFVNATISEIDALSKVSTRLGISTQALSEYQLVTERAGVSMQTFQMGIQRMTRRISEAAVGTGEAKAAIKELGLEATALNQLAPDEQFEILAEAISKVGPAADKVRLAMKLLDSEGVSLLQLMEKGGEGIKEIREEARRFGLTITEEMVEAAVEAKDAMANLGAVMTAIQRGAVLPLIIAFNDLARVLRLMPESTRSALRGLRTELRVMESQLQGLALLAEDPFLAPSIHQITDLTNRIEETTEKIEDLEDQLDAAAKGFEGLGLSDDEKLAKALEKIRDEEIRGRIQDAKRRGAINAALAKALEKIADEEIRGRIQDAKRRGAITEEIINLEKSVTRELMTEAQQRLAIIKDEQQDRLETIKQALARGEIKEREAAELRVKITQAALKKMKEQGESVARDLQSAFGTFTDSLVNDFKTAEDAFRALMQSVLRIFIDHLNKMIRAQAVTGGGSGAGGIIGFIRQAIAGFFVPAPAVLPVAPPSALGLPGVSVPTRHRGGPIRKLPSFQRGGEVPILAQSGEFMIRRSSADRLGGRTLSEINRTGSLPEPKVIVNVINQTSSQVETSERRGPGGIREIFVMIGREVARDVRNGGDVFRSISETFDLSRRGAIR